MALSNTTTLSAKAVYSNTHSLSHHHHHHHQPTFSLVPTKPIQTRISAVHAAEPSTKKTPSPAAPSSTKWTLDSWKTKKALHLAEYPDKNDLEAVLKTIEDFPPIVFAGEARLLEEKLGEAAMGNAFLLQGGDCAESFKEFSANYIRDTFRVILQMGAVLMFGGQVPIIKVGFFFFLIFTMLLCVCEVGCVIRC